jgi:ABC-2 type transport system permease protein
LGRCRALRRLSAALLLQTVVPLWMLLLVHVSVTGDRDAGMLRYVASFPVTRAQIGRAKALGVIGAGAWLLVPAALVGAAALVLTGAHRAEAAIGARTVLLTLSYLAYYGSVLAVGLALSALVRPARLALVALIGFWIATSVVVPRVSADVAQLLHPLPSALEFKHGVNRRILEGEHDRNAALRERMLGVHGVDEVDALPFNFEGLNLQDSEEAGNRIIDEAYATLDRALDAQDRVQLHAGWLSPLQPARALSMALSGTDSRHHRRFADAAEAYRREMVREMNLAVMNNDGVVNEGYVGTQTLNRMVGTDVWARVPPFRYTPPTAADVLRTSLYPLFLLGGWFVALAGMALRVISRMELHPA